MIDGVYFRIDNLPLCENIAYILRAGRDSPPAVIAFTGISPRASVMRSQQIRCDSGADGYSPDARDTVHTFSYIQP